MSEIGFAKIILSGFSHFQDEIFYYKRIRRILSKQRLWIMFLYLTDNN